MSLKSLSSFYYAFFSSFSWQIVDVFTVPTIAKRTLREIKLLKHFFRHDNIIGITTVLQPVRSVDIDVFPSV